MSTIECGIEASPVFKKDFKKTDLNNLAIWILKICYGKPNPSFVEILRVKKELKEIYAYEGIKF